MRYFTLVFITLLLAACQASMPSPTPTAAPTHHPPGVRDVTVEAQDWQQAAYNLWLRAHREFLADACRGSEGLYPACPLLGDDGEIIQACEPDTWEAFADETDLDATDRPLFILAFDDACKEVARRSDFSEYYAP